MIIIITVITVIISLADFQLLYLSEDSYMNRLLRKLLGLTLYNFI